MTIMKNINNFLCFIFNKREIRANESCIVRIQAVVLWTPVKFLVLISLFLFREFINMDKITKSQSLKKEDLPLADYIARAEFKIIGSMKTIKEFFAAIMNEENLDLQDFKIISTDSFVDVKKSDEWKVLESYFVKALEKKNPNKDFKILKVGSL